MNDTMWAISPSQSFAEKWLLKWANNQSHGVQANGVERLLVSKQDLLALRDLLDVFVQTKGVQ